MPNEYLPVVRSNPVKKPRRLGIELFEWLQMMMACVLVAVFLFNFLFRLTRVDGHSMDYTLSHGEMMLVWSLGYQPKAGDIVVINKKTATFLGGNAIVKRIIATSGQTVEIDYETGSVFVDGVQLAEPYIKEEMYRPSSHLATMQETYFVVPEGSIFVLGDNRNNSTDSRDSRLSYVDEDFILGKAVFALWPMGQMGII